MQDHCDVVIVGGRLAGACAASHLARAGRKVIVLDKSKFPSDQLSTHLLMPSGVDELRRMGALPFIEKTNPTKSRWVSLNATPVTVNERWAQVGESDYCVCIPRPLQDQALVDNARHQGADVRERADVTELLWRAGRVAGVRYKDADGNVHDVHAKLVIGADGRRSTVAAHVGAFAPYRASKNGRGLVFRYMDDPRFGTRDGETIFNWRDGDSFAFAFPSAPQGRILTLFMGAAEEASEARKDPEGYWTRKKQLHQGFADRVDGGTNLSKLRSTGDTTAFFRASSGPGWALAGDAGHFKDPVIGQGQRDAMWMARTLAETVDEHLDDRAALDQATRRWEHRRDRETLHAYHFGNIETKVDIVAAHLREIFRHHSTSEDPSVSDLFARSRTMPQVLTIPEMVRSLVFALKNGDATRGRAQLVRPALEDFVLQLRVRDEKRANRFRSTRPIPGSDRPHPNPPAAPASYAAPKQRHLEVAA